MFLLSKNGLTRSQSALLTALLTAMKKSLTLSAKRTRSVDFEYAVWVQSCTRRMIASRTGAARGVIFISAKWPRRDGRPEEEKRRDERRGEEKPAGNAREKSAVEIFARNRFSFSLSLSFSRQWS